MRSNADYQRMKDRAEAAEAELATLKNAPDWKAQFEMWDAAWCRELGYRLISKNHKIDALVLTTRELKAKADKFDRIAAKCCSCIFCGGCQATHCERQACTCGQCSHPDPTPEQTAAPAASEPVRYHICSVCRDDCAPNMRINAAGVTFWGHLHTGKPLCDGALPIQVPGPKPYNPEVLA